MSKTIIVINGKGGVGKDTLISKVAEKYKVMNVSSIDPIRDIAECGGYDRNDKSDKSRKLLNAIKKAFTEYNDLPNKHLLNEYDKFINNDNEILFIHIREPYNITKFIESIDHKVHTILIKSLGNLDAHVYGNPADDGVDNYDYDYIFNYYRNTEDFTRFIGLIEHIIENSQGG